MDRTFATSSTVVILLLLESVSWGLTYYVDADSGSDLNSGTASEEAWQTVARVNAFAFGPGDSILFRRGQTWRETLFITSSGQEGNPIAFGAYGTSGELPIINGADVYNGNEWRNEGENLWSKASHLQFDADFVATGRAVNKFIITIDGQRFLPVAEVDDLRENTYTYVGNSNRLFVYLSSDPDGHLTESATRDNSIRVYNSEHVVLRDLEVMNSIYNNVYIHGSKNILCEGLAVHHAGTRGIVISAEVVDGNPVGWAEYVTIQDSVVYNNGIRCDTAANDIGFGVNVRRITVRRNVLYGDGENWGVDGILTGESSFGAGHLIENNTIVGHCENAIDFKSHFQSPAQEGRTIVRNNILGGSDGAVINIHLGSRDVDILYNHICAGATHGISHYNHDGSHPYDGQEGNITIAYNIIRDNRLSGIRDGGAGASTTAGGNRVYNNVIVWNGKGVDADSAGIQFDSPHWDIRNNIIWDNGDGSVDYQLKPNTSQSQTGLVVSHNLVAEDPKFIDAEQGDFRLQADSPAIDAGVLLGYDRDLEGYPVPSGDAPDIGAYEYILPEAAFTHEQWLARGDMTGLWYYDMIDRVMGRYDRTVFGLPQQMFPHQVLPR